MNQIIHKRKCTGCGACVNRCPKGALYLEADEEGFLYPQINQSICVNCRICQKVCPVINYSESYEEPVCAYGAMNRRLNQRLISSSGGIFYLICKRVLDCGGVVVGAAFLDDAKTLQHVIIDSISEIDRLLGSKYLQSKSVSIYPQIKEVLEHDKFVLFSGTPCQIEGLNAFLGKKYDNLACIDFICHGVPSPLVWKKYVEFLENKYHSKVEKVSFRNKDYGWKKFSLKAEFKNNMKYSNSLDKDIYLQLFLKDLILRPSCYNCSFKSKKSASDITLADFWGVEHICPELDDDKGTSLVIVNSTKGDSLISEVKKDGVFLKVDFEEALKYNPARIRSAVLPIEREVFFKDLSNKSLVKAGKKYTKQRKIDVAKKKITSKIQNFFYIIFLKKDRKTDFP